MSQKIEKADVFYGEIKPEVLKSKINNAVEHITRVDADTDSLFGAGLFPVAKDLNAKVIPDIGLQVKVLDYYGMVDGYKMFLGSAKAFTSSLFQTLAVVTKGITYVGLLPAIDTGRELDEDTDDESAEVALVAKWGGIPKNGRGVVKQITEAQLPTFNGIIVAKLNVPTEATTITTAMIDNNVKSWLVSRISQRIIALEARPIGGGNGGGGTIGFDKDIWRRITKTDFKVANLTYAMAKSVVNGFVDILTDTSGLAEESTGSLSVAQYYPKTTTLKESKVYANCDAFTGYYAIANLVGSGEFQSIGGMEIGSIVDGKYDKSIRTGFGYSLSGTTVNFGPGDTMGLWANLNSYTDEGREYILINVTGESETYTGLSVRICKTPGMYSFDNAIILNYKVIDFMIGEVSEVSIAIDAGSLLGVDSWHQWTLTWIEGAVSLYIDGVLKGTLSGCGNMETRNSQFELGRFESWAGSKVDLDEIFITNQVILTAEEITALVASVTPYGTKADGFTLITNDYTATAIPTDVLPVVEGSEDLIISASRDGGTTWTVTANETLVDISGQPSGQTMKLKIVAPASTSYVDNLALNWKTVSE